MTSIATPVFDDADVDALFAVDLERTDIHELLAASAALGELPPAVFERRGLLCKRLAVLTGYTSKPIVDLTRLCLLKRRVFVDVFETPFGLYEEAVYHRDEGLVAFNPDLCFLCVGADHVGDGELPSELGRWQRLWEACHDLLRADLVQNVFEEPTERVFGNLEGRLPQSRTSHIRALNSALVAAAPPYVHFNDVDFLAAYHGRRRWRDERLYDLSKIPVSFDHMLYYAHNLAAVIAAVFGQTKKCLVLDLDNTLWGGVVGDDGVDHIEIGPGSPTGEAFLRFQRFVKSLKNRGVLLAVCSKNDEHIAREPFLRHPDMALRLDDISVFVANWESKADNIRAIAQTLNLGLGSFVFVDDNPAERALVAAELPEVEVVALPEDPAEFADVLAARLDFESVAITAEDMNRTRLYREIAERKSFESSTAQYADYLSNLEMVALLAPVDAMSLPRVVQLINKTNQFNLTTRRTTESEAAALLGAQEHLALAVRLNDRFGDHGLIAAVLAAVRGEELRVDTWVMSCRVLKRGVETLVAQRLVSEAQRRGLRAVIGRHIPTAKNGLVSGLYAELGFVRTSEDDDGGTTWRLDLADSAAVERLCALPVHIRLG